MAYKLENMHRRPRFAMIHLKAAQKLVHEAKTNDMGRFSDSKASAIGAIDEVVKMSLAHMEAVAAPQPTIHGSENIQFDSLDEARVYLEWFLVAKHAVKKWSTNGQFETYIV
ncbi:hypothetical protein H2200_012761 [Cladophialophora chaetospira]|uniref:Uncharacterized protein n=1 Tax=Cladophialophora chaetospira TaxID=386627 RepID=A0AA38WXH9_9EURO|nr:hypothetical protein H2200_012761 [Cladophialophora chaetospira]